MQDIQDRADVEMLVNSFYGKVKADALLSPIFNLSEADWQRHLPRMYDFWDNWLFQTGAYRGGMMAVHVETNEKHRLSDELFDRWLKLFAESVDSLFVGERAEFVKEKAILNGQIMGAKLNYLNQMKDQGGV
jgi:hemoglobin